MHFYLFFLLVTETRKDNIGTKNGAGSECMKTILLSILKSDYHISSSWVLKIIYFSNNPIKIQVSQSFLKFDKEIEENKQILKNLIEKI